MPHMSAAVVSAPRSSRVARVPRPRPGPHEVLVRVEGSGVCASSLPVWQGRSWFEYPRAPGEPGHEPWGRVEAVGGEVARWQPGDRVVFLSARAHAEFDVAAADALVPVPDAVGETPCPAEPVACAHNVFTRSRVSAGQQVAVVGIGFLGAIVTRLAARAGATVTALSWRPFSLDLALRSGANRTVQVGARHGATREAVQEAGQAAFDVVIEAAGTQQALDLATELAGERGTLVIAGYHQDGLRQVNLQTWNWRALDVVNAHERDARAYLTALRAALDLLAAGELDLAPLVTHRFALAELDAAFETLERRPEGFVKAVLLS